MRSRTSSSPLMSEWISSRSNGVTNVASSRWPVPWAMLPPVDRLHVATLNILNLADRWPERQGLIFADMAALQPDLLALQEVVYVMQQDRLIGAAGKGTYAAIRGWAGRPEYGNSLLVRDELEVDGYERLDLGRDRAAHRVRVGLAGGGTVLMVVTHL